MSMRKRWLPVTALAAAAGAGLLLAGAPAEGQAPTTAAIVASDNKFRTVAGGEPFVTIAAGGHVDFARPGGSNPHNVKFTAAIPSVCGMSEGPAASASSLPAMASAATWAGGCDFAAAGSYPFICEVHGEMTGSVTVVGGGTTPPPPPPVSPPPVSPPPPPPPPPAAPAPAASGLRVTATQRSFTLRGSVQVRSAGSRLLARAFAKRRSIFGGRSNVLVQVGRHARQSVGPGRTSFAVPLTAAARRALRRSGRLAITFRLTVTPPSGTAYTATRTVILRAP